MHIQLMGCAHRQDSRAWEPSDDAGGTETLRTGGSIVQFFRALLYGDGSAGEAPPSPPAYATRSLLGIPR